MNNNFIVNKNIDTEKRIERYFLRYTSDLKLHFNLSDKEILKILGKVISKIKNKENDGNIWKILFSNILSP